MHQAAFAKPQRRYVDADETDAPPLQTGTRRRTESGRTGPALRPLDIAALMEPHVSDISELTPVLMLPPSLATQWPQSESRPRTEATNAAPTPIVTEDFWKELDRQERRERRRALVVAVVIGVAVGLTGAFTAMGADFTALRGLVSVAR